MTVKRIVSGAVVAFAFLGLSAASAQTTPKAEATPAPAAGAGVQYRELILGDAKAPVTIIEYASLTCSHCQHFHKTSYPELKKNYIDTGKVRFVFRDFPLDQLAFAGAVLARCAPGDRGIKLIDLMFKNQETWVRSEKPIEPLKGYAQLAGMSSDDVEACLRNEKIVNTVREVQTTASNLYKVQSTPTFFVEDEKLEGDPGYAKLAETIDAQLKKKKK